MKLLVVDFLFVNAHKDMNINFIKSISAFAEVDVVSLNGYYDNQKELFKQNRIILLDIDIDRRTGPLGSRRFSLELMKRTASFVKRKKYDAVLCLGFETTLFGLGLPGFSGCPLFVFHHKNIDELTSKMKRLAFGIYKNKVYHIVFEEYFRNRLVDEIGVQANRVFVVPHPAKPIKCVSTEKIYDCIGLCNSNDEAFIVDAVERENDFLKRNLHVLLRSKRIEKHNGAVEVIRGFMEKEVYDELMAAGKTIFVPLPKTYVFRLSGSIYDALSRGKLVYTTSKYYAEEYARRYPGICFYVDSVEQLIQRLQEQCNYETPSSSFRKFIEGHSIENVGHNIEQMIVTVLTGSGT